VLTWGAFRAARPDLAEAGRALFYQFGVGLGFLATVRPDGGPRVHPMCPIITDTGLHAFIVPGPKRDDLLRDGRYAMHGFPPAQNEDAIYLTGRAERRADPELWRSITKLFYEERHAEAVPPQHEDEMLFEFLIESCLLTRTTGHGDWNQQHTVWHAP
jgi:hypothetical protein